MTDPDVIIVEQVPGFAPALEAVHNAGGLLLSREAAWQLTIIALATAGPHIRAEVLADIADDLAEVAAECPSWQGSLALAEFAGSLDNASFQIREALNGRGAHGPVLD